MKMCRSGVKNMCKNRAKIRLHNDISFNSRKTPMKPIFFRHFAWTVSDKESSHVVEKFLHSEA